MGSLLDADHPRSGVLIPRRSTSASVTRADIARNDYNLNIPRYVDTFEEEEAIDLMAVRKEREKLKAELASLETQMAVYLKELGYE